MPSATYEPFGSRASAASTPDVVDLRIEGAGAMDGFADEHAEPEIAPGVAPVVAASTLTYERHYGLREKPFSLSTDPRFLYRSASHVPVLRDLAAAIRRREGLIVLTGDIGTGKTTVCRAVLGQLDRKTFATFVPDPFVTREDLLKTMLIDFGVMSVDDLVKGRLKGASRPDLSYPLYEFLRSLEPLDAFAVLVIDEAQNLSLPLLEEIRILSDLEAGRKLLQVVLVGQPEFAEQLRLPRMRQIDQRVSVHCELMPLDREGLSGYVPHRLQTAGAASGQLRVADEALDVVFAATGGVPRVVNLVCDKALAHGEHQGTFLIGADLVRAALRDLRLRAPLLPPPVPVPETPAAPSAAVEPPPAAPLEVSAVAAKPPPARTGVAPRHAGGLEALLDLPAIDLKVHLEDAADRPVRTPPAATVAVMRGKVWHATPRLGTMAASALIVLGATTGVSLVGYWVWLRPLWSAPIALPGVERPVVTWASEPLRPAPPPGDEQAGAARPVPIQPTGASAGRAAATPVPTAGGPWAIQAGAFSRRERAAIVVAQLAELGYPAYQREFDFPSHGVLRVALVGPFASRQDADLSLARLRAVAGFEQSVVRRLQQP